MQFLHIDKVDNALYECLRKCHEQNNTNAKWKWPFTSDITIKVALASPASILIILTSFACKFHHQFYVAYSTVQKS